MRIICVAWWAIYYGFCLWTHQTVFATDTSEKHVISSSFELRGYDPDLRANGETDFKGETAVFDTEQRVNFLRHYAQYAQKYFSIKELDQVPVSDEETKAVVGRLKPQPQPTIRKRILLNDCKWLGYKHGQQSESLARIACWNEIAGAKVVDGHLRFDANRVSFIKKLPAQTWRFFVQWRVKVSGNSQRQSFSLLSGDTAIITIGFGENGCFFHRSANQESQGTEYSVNHWYEMKVEVDLTCSRYNFYVNDHLMADFVPMKAASTIDGLCIEGVSGTILDNLWGVEYQRLTEDTHYPYSIHTFIDEDYEVKPGTQNGLTEEYDDTNWQTGELPIVHGGERYAGEDLYIRKSVYVPDFERAWLSIETIDPEGEVWVNGQVVWVSTNRHPIRLDIGRFLKHGQANLIAIKIRHFDFNNYDLVKMPHTPTDTNFGWFTGRMYLDLVPKAYIEDVFVYTRSVSDPAEVAARITLKNEGWGPLGDDVNHRRGAFDGTMEVRLYKWFPQENIDPCVTMTLPVRVRPWDSKPFETYISVPTPALWTFQTPNLYKIVVFLKDQTGNPIDDYVTTMGIRTVSQDGGIFRINNQPEMINGAQLMGFRPPLDKIATWSRCAPEEWIVKEILLNKKMNGNGLKMQIHQWQEPASNINDPRYAEVADQLGFMYIWATTAWDRTGSPWGVDLDGYPRYMKQVYNHPSIVMWLLGGHFRFDDREEADRFYEAILPDIITVDPSRLISLNEQNSLMKYGNDAGTFDTSGKAMVPSKYWKDSHIVRGNQDAPTGYGKEWSILRKWPNAYTSSLLGSRTNAYFNIEHEESAGQPNWDLLRGKPFYQIPSYEWSYDEGSIGRQFGFDEWRESQAWQAFSAYEATKKERLLGYNGFSWCCLDGGANTATYQKPLLDFFGHAKQAYYIHQLAYQRVLAGSDNVDVVYGPDDAVRPVILNLGDAKTVNLEITVQDMNRKAIDQKKYENINLPAGRSITKLAPYRPHFPESGIYAVEYRVIQN